MLQPEPLLAEGVMGRMWEQVESAEDCGELEGRPEPAPEGGIWSHVRSSGGPPKRLRLALGVMETP